MIGVFWVVRGYCVGSFFSVILNLIFRLVGFVIFGLSRVGIVLWVIVVRDRCLWF